MFYSIRHVTRFVYTPSVTESMTEVRMQPRAEGPQRCLKFELHTSPRARVLGYRDHLGNIVHHFDIPGKHSQLKITAESTVEISPSPSLPDSLSAGSWDALDAINQSGIYWDYLSPSDYARNTDMLTEFSRELKIEKRGDPLNLMREINAAIYDRFDYAPQSTSVDS